MQVSSAFVVIMGMGVTFVGLTCIIFLTVLMGKILSKPEAPKPVSYTHLTLPTSDLV